jgi:hypothetical protein
MRKYYNVLNRSAIEPCKNKIIETIRFYENLISIVFSDNTALELKDATSGCCNQTYLTCDDDLSSFTGQRLIDVDLGVITHYEDDTAEPGGNNCHDIVFLNVRLASGEVIVFSGHNHHNGGYEGFDVNCKYIPGN